MNIRLWLLSIALLATPALFGQTPKDTMERATRIIFPRVYFVDVPAWEGLEFLAYRSTELSPDGKGMTILLKGPRPKSETPQPAETTTPAPLREGFMSIDLRDVSLKVALERVAKECGYDLRWDKSAVFFQKKTADGKPHIRPQWNVTPEGKELAGHLETTDVPKINLPPLPVEKLLVMTNKLEVNGKLLNVVLQKPADAILPEIEIKAATIPVAEYLQYLGELADLDVTVEKERVLLSPRKK